MQMLREGPEVDATDGLEGTPLPRVGAGPPAASSWLFACCHPPGWSLGAGRGKAHVSPVGLRDSKRLAL